MKNLEEMFSSELRVTNSAGSVKKGKGNVHVTLYNPQPTDGYRMTLQIVPEESEPFPFMKLEDDVPRQTKWPWKKDLYVRLRIPWEVLEALKVKRFELVVQTPKNYRAKSQQILVLESYLVDLENRKVRKRK